MSSPTEIAPCDTSVPPYAVLSALQRVKTGIKQTISKQRQNRDVTTPTSASIEYAACDSFFSRKVKDGIHFLVKLILFLRLGIESLDSAESGK